MGQCASVVRYHVEKRLMKCWMLTSGNRSGSILTAAVFMSLTIQVGSNSHELSRWWIFSRVQTPAKSGATMVSTLPA